jgi:hypothetical protein
MRRDHVQRDAVNMADTFRGAQSQRLTSLRMLPLGRQPGTSEPGLG